jgi:hypothetical protein
MVEGMGGSRRRVMKSKVRGGVNAEVLVESMVCSSSRSPSSKPKLRTDKLTSEGNFVDRKESWA